MRTTSILAIAQSLTRRFGAIQPMSMDPPPNPQPLITGRAGNKPHQRQAKRKRSQRRAKRLKHY